MRKAKNQTQTTLRLWTALNLDVATVQRLDQLAKTEDRPRSWVIRQLLIRALEAQEKTA